MAGSPQKVSFKTFDGTTLRGYYYAPRQPSAPIIILTAGLSFLKEHFIDAFAYEFQKAGFAALCYDHRNWGASDGLPRHHTAFWQQVDDYSDAITYAISLAPAIDPKRICVWGAGHAGGVVMPVTAYDKRVKCMVTMVPFISGSEDAKYYPEDYLDKTYAERTTDTTAGTDWKTKAEYVPIFAAPDDDQNVGLAVIGVPEAYTFYQRCKARSDAAGSEWKNEMTLQSLWYGSRWEPTRENEKIGAKPVLYVVAEQDKFIPIAAQKTVFEHLRGPKELLILESEHLDTYMGETFSVNFPKQVTWLKKWL